MWNRCCCGRIKDFEGEDNSLRINDYVHERLGIFGAFCGPWQKHYIRDLEKDNEQLRKALSEYLYETTHLATPTYSNEKEYRSALISYKAILKARKVLKD